MTTPNDTASTLLGFLHDRPMTGWELAETVQLTIGSFWNVSRSQVYRELKTLEQEEYVIGGDRGAREKRAYTITESGRAAFKDWISKEPGPEIARYPMLVTVWFGDHLDEEDLAWALQVHYARHRKKLAFLQSLAADTTDQTTPAARALRFGRMYEEMVVAWFETLPWFGGKETKGRAREQPRPSRPARPSDYPTRSETLETSPATKASRSRKPSPRKKTKQAGKKKSAKKAVSKKRPQRKTVR